MPRRWRSAWIALGLLALGPGLPAPAVGEAPRVLYMLQCQGCHGPDGVGAPGSVPTLAGFVGRFLEVPGGREYLVQVPGSARSPLSDSDLAAVLNWMVVRFGPEEVSREFRRYEAPEVGRARATPLIEVRDVRARLLESIERARRSGPDRERPREP